MADSLIDVVARLGGELPKVVLRDTDSEGSPLVRPAPDGAV